jgi:hypothetical protein
VFTCVDHYEYGRLSSTQEGYIRKEEKETEYSPELYGMRTVGRMCVLKSEFAGFSLFLPCSTKYFSDMGSSRIKGEDGEGPKNWCRKLSEESRGHVPCRRPVSRIPAGVGCCGQG